MKIPSINYPNRNKSYAENMFSFFKANEFRWLFKVKINLDLSQGYKYEILIYNRIQYSQVITFKTYFLSFIHTHTHTHTHTRCNGNRRMKMNVATRVQILD